MVNNIPNNPIYVLIGKAATGKSTLEKSLEINKGYHRAISFTTRPKRDNEIDGVDYYFITNDEFLKKLNKQEIYENVYYNVNGETWYYGLGLESFTTNEPNVVVVNPHGLYQLLLIKDIRDRMVVVQLSANLETRINRYLDRDLQTPDYLETLFNRPETLNINNVNDTKCSNVYLNLIQRIMQDEKDFGDDLLVYDELLSIFYDINNNKNSDKRKYFSEEDLMKIEMNINDDVIIFPFYFRMITPPFYRKYKNSNIDMYINICAMDDKATQITDEELFV